MAGSAAEIVLKGIGISHDIAIAPAYLVQVERPHVVTHKLAAEDLAGEKTRFDSAVMQVQRDLAELKEKSSDLPEAVAEEVGMLLDAHLAMLAGSRLVRGVLKKIEEDALSAESAVEFVIRDLTDQFKAIKDAYISARIDDVEAVGNRLIRVLMDLPYISLDSVPAGGIVLAKEISPSDTALLNPQVFAGIATVHGGAAGHTAIVARSLGLPAVLGVDIAMLETGMQGQMAIVDGIEGKLILHPSEATLEIYRGRQKQIEEDKTTLAALTAVPAVTEDGTPIHLSANLELPRDAPVIHQVGAAGIGLFRTEFLFMGRTTVPTEDEQYESMARVVREMAGETVTFRTLDIGGDKLARAVGEYLADADNPALGLRAIRLSLKEPHLLKTQLRAMLRTAALGPVRVLLPMVTVASEVETARSLYKACYKELKEEGMPVPRELPPLGVMIEIPAAALSADSLAGVSDFFSLGTNDLVQYTIAIDRGNDQVAALYNPLNPAVLRLMEFSIEAGNRAGIPVSICGEMGANPLYTPLLLGLGLRAFSVGPANLPRLKKRISEISLEAATRHARQVMNQYDPVRITELVHQFKP